MVSEDILRNVFNCIIDNLKRYPTTNKIKYRNWLRIINRNKQDNIDYAKLNEYFEDELKNLFPKTCSESVFGSCLPKKWRHFSRREGLRDGRVKTNKKGKRKNTKKKKRRN